MVKKKLGLLVLIVALLLTVGGQAVFAAQDTSTAPQQWDVSVSLNRTQAIEVFSMFPSTLIIHEGDTVTFTNKGFGAPHTVTFWGQTTPLAPEEIDESFAAPNVPSGSSWDGKTLLNSGIFFPGSGYSVTFTASGVFPYLCLVHPTMTGTIIVVPKGQPIPSKADQLAEQKAQLGDFNKQVSDLNKQRSAVNYTKNKDGSLTYTAYAGMGTSELLINQYAPGTFYINEGDSIKWITDSHEFQFVMFNVPKDFKAMSDTGELNPLIETASGTKVFDGKGFVRSGPIMPDMPFELKFSKAGTYTFTDPLWVKSGKVIVAPKGATKLIVNNVPVVTDVQVKQGQTLILASSIAKITKAKLVVGKNVAKYTINKKTYVSIAEVVGAVGGDYHWDSTSKTVYVTAK